MNLHRLVTSILGGLLLVGAASTARADGTPRRLQDTHASAGRAIYLRECAACHGERGDGQSVAAAFLEPRPRNFLSGLFKLRTTPSGEAPRTDDVVATIEKGIPGSSMPSFAYLSVDEREKLAAYVLGLGDLLDQPEPTPVPTPASRPDTSAETIARGKTIYEEQQCGACHGAKGKGDGASAKALKDSEGRPIPVRDFTTGLFRGGQRPIDLYYRFTTGMDGSPMPSFGDLLDDTERWALVDYIMSLRVEAPPRALPKDPIKAGRAIAEKYGCRGCHVLDDGKGGDAGPNLKISGQKLRADWIRRFLRAPRDHGKIYPVRQARMPDLRLTDEEVEALVGYLAKMGGRKGTEPAAPDVTTFAAARLEEGKNLFVLRCTECHTLGTVIETPLAKQQGPDLIRASERVHFDWAARWILDPKKIDPSTKMTVPGLTPDQIESVRQFVWKTSVDRGAAASAQR
ncbi:c-type cytochrome [Myxococcota bacterium]|nr:c-type cytochrome [Myxococcota bacterium]